MLDFVKKYANSGRYSQNGEEGIIDECLRRIKPDHQEAVEFGGADGYYCSNTAHLRDRGWKVRMYDVNPSGPLVEKEEITSENVIGIVDICSVLSIDTDGHDYEIWQAYLSIPDIVVIEINSGLNPMQDAISYKDGANYSAMVKLGLSKDYFLLCHTGNLVFVHRDHRDKFPEITADPFAEWPLYFNKYWLPK
jgi:hypothetical protein